MAEQVNKAFHAWVDARKKNSFSVYEPELDALIKLKREEAGLLGYEHHPYNALLDEFEKGCTVELLDRTFSHLLPTLQELVRKISEKPQVDDAFLLLNYPKQKQWDWGMELIKKTEF